MRPVFGCRNQGCGVISLCTACRKVRQAQEDRRHAAERLLDIAAHVYAPCPNHPGLTKGVCLCTA